jgi:hypothetical protein
LTKPQISIFGHSAEVFYSHIRVSEPVASKNMSGFFREEIDADSVIFFSCCFLLLERIAEALL